MTRIDLQPYTTAQLEKIVQARLECAKTVMGEAARVVVGTDASMKVSIISGDARRSCIYAGWFILLLSYRLARTGLSIVANAC